MDKSILKLAFDYFNINDKNYINNCMSALNLINNDKSLYDKCDYAINYLLNETDDNKLIRYAKKDYNEVFNCDNKFITNVIVLSQVNKYIDYLNKFDIVFKQVQINNMNKRLLKEKDGMDIRRLVKSFDYIKGKIFEVGCLQFQITNIYFEGCNIKIHIPRGVNFNIDNVLESIEKSKYYLKEYYNIDNPKYYCDSWMLGKTTKECLNENSNIYKFGNLFDIKENHESNEILRFIYPNVGTDYTKLEEKSSLQRKIKEKLLSGEKMYNGVGVLK